MELFLIKCLAVQWVKQNTPSSHYIRNEKNQTEHFRMNGCVVAGTGQEQHQTGRRRRGLLVFRGEWLCCLRGDFRKSCLTELLKGYEMNLNEPKVIENCKQSCLL